MEFPDPGNDQRLNELHKFMDGWIKKHSLSSAEEFYLLSSYLSGRLHVNNCLCKIRNLFKADDEIE
jgi:hypothetical protein